MKIVKPFDWSPSDWTYVSVIVEGLSSSEYSLEVYRHDDFFLVRPSNRIALLTTKVEARAGDIGTAVLGPCGPWGRCVISVIAPDGEDVAQIGVNLAHSERTGWQLSRTDQDTGSRNFRYPLPLLSADVSHTPGDIQVSIPLLEDLDTLCKLPAPAPGPVAVVVVDQPKDFDGLANLSLNHSRGKDEPVFGEMLASGHWSATIPYIAKFGHVEVSIPSGLVALQDGLWSDSTLTAFFNDPELRNDDVLFRAHGKVGSLGAPYSERDLLNINGLDQWPGIPMVLSNVGYRNHAHWMMNSLLAAWYARVQITAGQICVLVPEWSTYIVSSLQAVGVPRSAIVVARKGSYKVDEMLYPSTLSTHVNRFPSQQLKPMFSHILAHCQRLVRLEGPKLVYLTRQGSGAQRHISNEAELIEALIARRFICIAPHELTFEEEVCCLANASVIVGQLGAALVNIAFAPSSAWVIELASRNYASSDYWQLSSLLGQRFVRIVAPASEDGETLTDFSFEVPLAATLESIDRVCAEVVGMAEHVE